MNQINAMRQALEALENLQGLCSEESDFVEQVTIWTPEAIDDLRQAIEQAEKVEPISSILTKWKTGMICGQDAMVLLFRHYSSDPATPTTPAQRPLTRAEKNRIWSSCSGAATLPARASLFGTKIEAAHGIKGAKHD